MFKPCIAFDDAKLIKFFYQTDVAIDENDERLFKSNDQSKSDSKENNEPELLKTDLKLQFEKAISTTMISIATKPVITSSMQKEFSFFEVSAEKSENLSLLF